MKTRPNGESAADARDSVGYYAQRWMTEERANLWAMSRASIILREIVSVGIKQPKMLDFGCGTGWLTEILAQFGEAEGIDLAPEAARTFHPKLRFHSAESPPLGPFDVIVSQEVLEHAEDQSAYLATAYRLLRPGGALVLTTPNARVSIRNPSLLVQPIEKHLTRAELRSLLLSEGFLVERTYSFFYGYAKWCPYRIQMRFGRLLNAGLHLMAVCRKPA